MKKLFKIINKFIRKWGIFGILAIITLYIPLWLGFVLQSSKLISFGWKWTAIWAMPIPPAWLMIGVIAGFYKTTYYWVKKRITKKIDDQ